MPKLTLLTFVLLSAAWAADRPDLNGTWQLSSSQTQGPDAKAKAYTLTIHQTDDTIALNEAITDPDGKERKVGIQCKTDGDACKIKDGTVTLWYDGPALVLMNVQRNNVNVVERRFQPSEDGKSLVVKVSPIAPPGQKQETLTFEKQTTAAAN
jgi:hypothetical protein